MSGAVIQLSGVVENLTPRDKEFANSLISQFQAKGRLSDSQLSWVSKLIEKAVKPKETAPTTEVQNFNRIIEVFDTARANEYKAPKLRLGDKDFKIVLSEASNSSINAGMIYVKVDGEYRGKISRDGQWRVSGSADPKLLSALTEFAIEPLTMLKKYGFATSTCSLCGRRLSDPESIKAGVGPICAQGWGF